MQWIVVVLAVLIAAGPVRAEGFWDKKKFADWTDKEVRKMVSDSPWAQRVEIPMGGGGGGGGRGRRGGGGGGGGGFGGGGGGGFGAEAGGPDGGGGGLGEAGGGREPGMGDTGGGVVPTLSLTIRWQSALPIRQALARMRFGPEAGTSKQAAEILAREQQFYVVAVSGVPARFLTGAPVEKLKMVSMLRLSKTESVPATDVQINPGQPLAEMYLIFPRTRALRLEDKEVEILTSLGPVEVRRKFRLKDMVLDGKLEL